MPRNVGHWVGGVPHPGWKFMVSQIHIPRRNLLLESQRLLRLLRPSLSPMPTILLRRVLWSLLPPTRRLPTILPCRLPWSLLWSPTMPPRWSLLRSLRWGLNHSQPCN